MSSGAHEAGLSIALGQRVHKVVGGGAGTNHHFRVINHRVLGTLWGYTKLELTCGGHLMVAPHHGGVWALVGGGGAAADPPVHHHAHWSWVICSL